LHGIAEKPHGRNIDPHATVGAGGQQSRDRCLLDHNAHVNGHHAELGIRLLEWIFERLAILVDVAVGQVCYAARR
jgi:hypothetical protein